METENREFEISYITAKQVRFGMPILKTVITAESEDEAVTDFENGHTYSHIINVKEK
jgi:hypothetical protein